SDGGGATAAVTVAENQRAVTTVTATDVDVPADPLTFTIIGGADAARFSLDPTSGALTFLVPPDFEAPADADGNNVYDVTVQVSDGNGGVDTQLVRITVSDVQEGIAQAPPSAPTPTAAPSPRSAPEPLTETTSSTTGTPAVPVPGSLEGPSMAARDLSRGPGPQSARDWSRVLEVAPFLRPDASGTTSEQIRAYAPAPVLLSSIELGQEFLQQLNAFSDELVETTQQTLADRSVFITMLEYTGVGISGVIVAWLLRSGTLLASLLAALPAWRSVDPIAILDMDDQGRKTWTKRMKETAEKEAREHLGLDQMLDPKRGSDAPPSSASRPRPS
ncbi:MAG TPA: hypothetical protein PKK23_20530, partial [Nitrospirales bacterium]|nr:hypothetical protein [Nitrospirales bacterium]